MRKSIEWNSDEGVENAAAPLPVLVHTARWNQVESPAGLSKNTLESSRGSRVPANRAQV